MALSSSGSTVIIGSDASGNTTNTVDATVNGLKVDGSAVTQPVSGTVAATQSGSWSISSSTSISPYLDFIPLSFGASITSPAYPAIKSLLSYVVPVGKTLLLSEYSIKTAAVTTYMSIHIRKVLWSQNAVAVVTPGIATLTARTISGAGLGLGTYRYKIVAVNVLGKTIGGTEASLTLTGAQNAISLAWTAVAGALYYEVYRTVLNGAISTEVFAMATENVTIVDILADASLGVTTPPISNTTVGSAAVGSFPTGRGASSVVVDTMSAITAATAIDIIYLNNFGFNRYLTVTPGLTAGSQVPLIYQGLTNPLADNRIMRQTANQEYTDIGISSITSVGNLPVTGSIQIIGIQPLAIASAGVINSWSTVYFSEPISIPAGTEVVIGTSATVAVTVAARNDLIVIGKLV